MSGLDPNPSSLERRPIPGYEAYYEITRRGDVYSKRLNKFIKQQERQERDFSIELQIEHERHRLPLVQTIADAFLSDEDKAAILAAVPNVTRLSKLAIRRHPAVIILAQRFNLTPAAILSVLERARDEAE